MEHNIQNSDSISETADLVIRPAIVDDVPLLLQFVRELAEYEQLTHVCQATEENLYDALFGKNSIAEAALGFVEEHPVLFATYYYCFSTFIGKPGIYIEDMYVKPRMRGRGYGKRMLRYLAHLTVERGCDRLEWAVLDWNEPAISFYERLGAEARDEWMTYRLTGHALRGLAE